MITPTRSEKLEWARMAQDMYRNDLNEFGHRYSGMASIRDGVQVTTDAYDSLMFLYRIWLVSGIAGFLNK